MAHWQQRADYTIDVELDESTHTLAIDQVRLDPNSELFDANAEDNTWRRN